MRADGAGSAAHQAGALVERVTVVIVQPDHRSLMPGQSTKGAIEVRVRCRRRPRVTVLLAQRQQAEQPALDAETAANADLLEPRVQPLRIPQRTPGAPGKLHRVLDGGFSFLPIGQDRAGQATKT